MGAVARTRASRWLTRAFVHAYGVDLSEAEGGIEDYPTLEDLFTRTLKPGARPIAAGEDALVSPVDGTVAAAGRTHDGGIDVAPGRRLDVAELLGVEAGGEFDVAVLYLSPKDYHRVHVPREGDAVAWSYLPGTLWPVFPAAVQRVDNLFSRNERFRVTVDTSGGPLEVVLVGAFGVGRITVAVTDIVTNDGVAEGAEGQLEPPVALERGAWLGTFHLGSTVILSAPAGAIRWEVAPGTAVRFGERIGALEQTC
jgi:phosphatidylserine decarboxylase